MKLVIILSLLFSISSFSKNSQAHGLETLKFKFENIFETYQLSPNSFSIVYDKHNNIPFSKEVIEELLATEFYIDEQSATILNSKDASLFNSISELLNFNKIKSNTYEHEILLLSKTLFELSQTGYDIYKLASNGYGSFGVSQGLAVVNKETNQVLIVQSGVFE